MVEIIKNAIRKFNAYYLFQAHKHNHYEIIYIISGQCIMVIDNNDLALNVGDCIMVDNNIEHQFYVNGSKGCKINQLEIVADNINMSKSYYKLTDCRQIDNCLNNIIVYQNEKLYQKNKVALIELEINKVLLLLDCTQQSQRENGTCKHVDKTMQIIKQNNYCDINFSEIAKESGISDRYLRKIFEKQIGINPKQYLTNLRMEKAKKLLSFTANSVSEIAVEVGYNTVQYFSKVFKVEIGLSPKDFRNFQAKSKAEYTAI